MSTAFRRLVLIVILAVVAASLGYLGWPWLKNAMYLSELLAEEPPQSLPIPVQGVSMRAVRDTFGVPRPGNRTHQGIDIFAPRGTPVISSTRGLVARIGENSLGGTVVWVLGPSGDRHYYAHLNSVADIKIGQRVVSGDVLGMVGTTGNARGTPPHLHYGVYRRGRGAINPFPLLANWLAEDKPSMRRRGTDAERGAE
ncbi:MAG TPA: M23 family metallopeptidase [Burkholderiaceae bacterium]|nr:M23 family metallopeptidase [Burkholderiaceae bacterium]